MVEVRNTDPEAEKLQLISAEAAAALLGCDPETMACWRCEGTGPRFVKVGRLVRYNRADIEKWVLARTFESTSRASSARGGR